MHKCLQQAMSKYKDSTVLNPDNFIFSGVNN